ARGGGARVRGRPAARSARPTDSRTTRRPGTRRRHADRGDRDRRGGAVRTPLTGIGGGLLPLQYLTDRLGQEAEPLGVATVRQHEVKLMAWWKRVAETCGPATGARALFD